MTTDPATQRPRIVVLCGSTRFYEAFQQANYRETMAGRIVLSVGFYPHSSEQVHGQHVGCDDAQKAALDELHLRKIDLADEVLVIDKVRPWCPNCKRFGRVFAESMVSGHRSACCFKPIEWKPYVGESTRREIAYATYLGKPIRYLSQEATP